MTRGERADDILRILRRTYPDAHCELIHRNPFELLVATILSAQCTDVRVNMVTPALFKKYPDARSMAGADPADLENLIRSTGFYRNKAKNIRAASAALADKHQGEVPRDLDALTVLPGVGRKTANVVLGNAYGIESGVVVDTHVGRLSQRLGLTKHRDPVKIEQDLMRVVPRNSWTLWSHLLIWHGRRRCYARNPDCGHCELSGLCPTAGKHGTKKKMIAKKSALKQRASN
ncbi:MAG: endonuclease III [Chthoniobacterales bacterium]